MAACRASRSPVRTIPTAPATRQAGAGFSCALLRIASEEASCARKIVSNLARRAFRRNLVDDAEVDGLMAFYERGRKEGDFETGIQQAVARILVAPRFVFRMEDEPPSLKDGAIYRVGDVALASRLSFFLWSSMPDDELLDLAAKGPAEGSGRSRAAGAAHADGSEVAGADRQFRRPMAVPA